MEYKPTMAINQGPEAPRPDRTPPAADRGGIQPNFEGPVFGWLVCAQGPFAGMDRPILRAVTYIGNGQEVDLGPVAADTVLAISYEAETGLFALFPQAGAAQVNDAPLTQGVYLQPHDRISAGGSVLVFVPAYG